MLDTHMIRHTEGVSVLMAIRKLRKHCCIMVTAATVEEAPQQPEPQKASAPGKSKKATPVPAFAASPSDRETYAAYLNVMHAVGAAEDVWQGERVLLRSVMW